ncbi:alpha-(1,3)-fucosyltransferase C-like [Macrobrachium rosenbergii]|uniref:alpha-(1,3)-fucosyltransferase C-like n=1 Tax=Macrobrachium rosenbergii TaxID=79674 RepID=UPI0034D768A3
MNQRFKTLLLLMSMTIMCVLLYMNERGLFTTTSFLFDNVTGRRSVVPSKWLPEALLNTYKSEYFEEDAAEKNPNTSSLPKLTFPESRSVPLRGAGDSLLPLEPVNATNIEGLPEDFWFENKTTRTSVSAQNKGDRPLKKILFWNDVFGNKSFYFGFGREPFVKAKCPVSSCFTTANRSLFSPEEVDAVIWHVRSEDKSLPPVRSPHTRYVFWSLESPPHMFTDLKLFDNIFNWTFTYRLDSDFPNPYITVYRRRTPKSMLLSRNYASGKKSLAAWFVSNCITDSGRETLVKTLQRWIKIDVYGFCGPFKCRRVEGETNCYEMLERNYKFYLSFENSLCQDYATEKVFSIIRYNVVPVVYGLGNYTVQLPPDSYIDALDFPTAKSLAAYLHYLDKNDTAYNEYFSWKAYHRLPATWDMFAKPWCDLCARLHGDRSRKVYEDIDKWFITDSKCVNDQTPEISRFISGLPYVDVTDPKNIDPSSVVG